MFATNGRAAPLWHLALNLMRSTTMEQCVFLVAACVASGPVYAGDVGEMQAASIQLQGFSGVVYYTSESGGYRVVATLSEGESGLPVRFEATLLDGQKLTIQRCSQTGRPKLCRGDDALAQAASGFGTTFFRSSFFTEDHWRCSAEGGSFQSRSPVRLLMQFGPGHFQKS
jgi:hypothetical protein